VKSLEVKNPFWSIGSLDHPNEPCWAVDSNVQKGIQAVLSVTHCTDKLRQISREARQAVKWAVKLAPCVELVKWSGISTNVNKNESILNQK
jgi:hypothetical protein